MFFISEQHKQDFKAALDATDAAENGGKVNGYLCASLYLLTGLTGAWGRLRVCVGPGYIDTTEMLVFALSSGEEIIVRLAGNFYNGGFWTGSPWDMVSSLDGEHLELVLCAFRLRSRTITKAALFAA